MLLGRLFVALQPPLWQPRRGVHDVPHAVMAVRRALAEWRIGGHQSARDLVSLMTASGQERSSSPAPGEPRSRSAGRCAGAGYQQGITRARGGAGSGAQRRRDQDDQATADAGATAAQAIDGHDFDGRTGCGSRFPSTAMGRRKRPLRDWLDGARREAHELRTRSDGGAGHGAEAVALSRPLDGVRPPGRAWTVADGR